MPPCLPRQIDTWVPTLRALCLTKRGTHINCLCGYLALALVHCPRHLDLPRRWIFQHYEGWVKATKRLNHTGKKSRTPEQNAHNKESFVK